MVTACSGIRYLLATITVGTVYAYLNISSGLKRGMFLVASVLVALVGNWMRALGIVLLGHYSGNKLAVGADHLVYGWVFFGFLVFFLIAVGEIFFAERAVVSGERTSDGDAENGVQSAVNKPVADMGIAPGVNPTETLEDQRARGGHATKLALVVLVIALIAGVESLMGARLSPSAGVAGALQGPPPTPAGYRIEGVAAPTWQPDFGAGPLPSAFRMVQQDTPDKSLELLVYVWSDQGPALEALAAVNVIAAESNEEWVMVGAAARPRALTDGSGAQFAASLIRSPGGAERRVGLIWYTPQGRVKNALAMKLADLRSRLRFGRAPAWGVVISDRSASHAIGDWAAVDAAVTAFVEAARAQGWPTLAAQTPSPENLPQRVDEAVDNNAAQATGAH